MLKRLRTLPVLGLVLLSVLLSAGPHEAAPPRTENAAASISAGITHRTMVRSQPTPLVVHVVEIDLAKTPGALKLVANQSAPDGGADRIFKSLRHPRTAVGVDSARKKVWLIVADGRQPGVSEGATLDELKQMLKEEGAVDALNLDGGGSSVLVARVPGSGLRVLNVPIHDRVPDRERPVVSALGMTSGN